MARVTSLLPDPSAPDRRLVLVDGLLIGSASVALLARLHIDVGSAFGADMAKAVRAEDPATACFEHALRLLEVRGRTTTGLRHMLREREGDPVVVDQVVDRLEAVGLLNDLAYAETWTRQALMRRGFARARCIAHLVAQGITEDVATAGVAAALADQMEAIGAASVEAAEDDALTSLAQKRLRKLAGLPRATQARRLAALLARRGYGEEAVRGVLEALVGDPDDRAGSPAAGDCDADAGPCPGEPDHGSDWP